MSKWNRPMRRYTAAALNCEKCGQPIRLSEYGWTHVQRASGITSPDWHVARPEGARGT